MKKWIKYLLILIPIALLILFGLNYRKLELITGYAAKNACSCVFVAEMRPERVEEEDNNFFPVSLANVEIDRVNQSTQAVILGLGKRTAVYRKGMGCTLLPINFSRARLREEVPNRNTPAISRPYPFGHLPPRDTVFENLDYSKLRRTVASAFDKPGEGEKKTRAVVILYKGFLIAEAYAPGFHSGSRLQGWSMTKSITASIMGVLAAKDLINLQDDHLLEVWKNDRRNRITFKQLLQMNSGLKWKEDYTEVSDVTSMLFWARDMSQTQVVQPLETPPGSRWKYSSGVTNLLSGLIREKMESYQVYLDFWYKAFIDRIGMKSMILETDAAGNYVASSYSWATARDWARMGLFYLRQGRWNGEQLLSRTWTDFVSRPVPGSGGDYGGHFWLNKGAAYPDVPRDLLSANGYQGQYVFIIPSKDLVVVRLGLTEHPEFDVNSFLSGILSAID